MKRLLAIVVFLVTVVPAFAVQPSEMLKDPALEARARALSAELRCLVCQNQSIDDSDAPLAHDLRVLLREQLMKGQTDAQVMDFVVSRYGDYVLLKPPFKASTLILWTLPFGVLLLAGALMLRRRSLPATPAEAPLTDAERRLLDALKS